MDQSNIPSASQQAKNIAQLCNDASYAGNVLQLVCHSLAVKSGWWIDPATGADVLDAAGRWAPFVIATKIALIHSEASEALEGHRKSAMDDKLSHRTMVEVELADVVIRVCDLAGRLGLNLGDAIAEKLEFNQSRADHKLENRAQTGGKAY